MDSPPRIALVIGNSDYARHALENAAKDAKAVGEKLHGMGWLVRCCLNVTEPDFRQEVEAFGKALQEHHNTIGLFFYAGHGFEMDGERFLLPIDRRPIRDKSGVMECCISVKDALQRRMSESADAVNIVLLDCCRAYPNIFVDSSTTLRHVQRVHLSLPAGPGWLLAFACSQDRSVSDRTPGQHSLFTEQLLHHLPTSGVTADEMLKRVVTDVVKAQQQAIQEGRLTPSDVQVPECRMLQKATVCLASGSDAAPPAPLRHFASKLPLIKVHGFPDLPNSYVNRMIDAIINAGAGAGVGSGLGAAPPEAATQSLVEHVERVLLAHAPAADTNTTVGVVAVKGMGGVGKTVLAIATCLQSKRVREHFSDAYWVNVGSEAKVEAVQRTVLQKLEYQGAVPEKLSVERGCELINRALRHRCVLLVLDDVWSSAILHGVRLDSYQSSRILVTTRDKTVLVPPCARCAHLNRACVPSHVRDTPAQAALIDVGKLDTRTSLALLSKASGHASTVEPEQAAEVARRCGYLPLALSCVASAVHMDYLLERPWTEALRLLDASRAVQIPGNDEMQPVYEAIDMSVGTLRPEHVGNYLALACAFQEDWHIASDLALAFFEEGGMSSTASGQCLRTLESKSLVQRVSHEPPRVQIHDLQRDYARLRLQQASSSSSDIASRWVLNGLSDTDRSPQRHLYDRVLRAYARALPRTICTIRRVELCGRNRYRQGWTGAVVPSEMSSSDQHTAECAVISVPLLAKTLQTSHSLQTLRLTGLNIAADDQLFVHAVGKSESLQTLQLKSTCIGAAGAQILARALEQNTSLQTLDLYHDPIGDSGAQALARGLENNSRLQTLTLFRNNIGAAGAQALAQSLERNTSLQSLIVWNNSIGDAGAEAFAHALEHTTSSLRTLNLSATRIGPAGAQTLARALEHNVSLTTLNLNGNSIGTRGAQALVQALEHNATLQTVPLSGNDIQRTVAGRDALKAIEYALCARI